MKPQAEKKTTFWTYLTALSLALGAQPLVASELFRNLETKIGDWHDSLFYESPDGSTYLQASIQTDLTYYEGADGRPSGFFFPKVGDHSGFSPRLTVFLDAFLGDHLSLSTKLRWDDGVHPGVGRFYQKSTQLRIDEWYFRYRLDSINASLQVGQFTPSFGNFLPRQNSWDMALISYPHAYEGVLTVSDVAIPNGPDAFLSRRDRPLNQLGWVPIAWAPLYTRGASILGSAGDFNYSLSYLNAAPSSRGIAWNDFSWSAPTWMGRISWNPNPSFEIGMSASDGPYFRPDTQGFPTGTDLEDYHQTIAALDFQWSKRKVQIWSEILYSTFEIPNLPDKAKILSAYLEVRYDISPSLWAAIRWNGESYNKMNDSSGSSLRFDHPLTRWDFGLGWRPSRFWQLKIQGTHTIENRPGGKGNPFFAIESTLRF